LNLAMGVIEAPLTFSYIYLLYMTGVQSDQPICYIHGYGQVTVGKTIFLEIFTSL